jgi:hypothetical protein
MSRKNVSLTKPIDARAEKIITTRGFTGLSDMIAVLVREEFERRGLTLPDDELRETSAPYKAAKPVADYSASSAEDARDLEDFVKQAEAEHDRKHPAGGKTASPRRGAARAKTAKT